MDVGAGTSPFFALCSAFFSSFGLVLVAAATGLVVAGDGACAIATPANAIVNAVNKTFFMISISIGADEMSACQNNVAQLLLDDKIGEYISR